MKEKRNVMVESARIARGAVEDLKTLDASKFDAVFMPGGFGAAKNLSSFAFKGGDMTVIPEVESALKAFHTQQKIIALCCISPVVAARVFGTKCGGPGLTLTLGKKGEAWPYNGSIDVAKGFGNNMQEKGVNEVCIDAKNKVYSTPCYMKGDAKPHEVFEGISRLVKEVGKALKKK